MELQVLIGLAIILFVLAWIIPEKKTEGYYISEDCRRFQKHYEENPDDPAEMPLNTDGTIDYDAVQHMSKNSREEKIVYCALCNKIFGTYIFSTFSKLSDEALQNQVEAYECHWPENK